MNQIDVLIVADTEGALASGDLQSNVYLIDSNKHFGSGSEGQAELRTACQDGQIIRWQVVAVSPDSDVEINGFTGQMVKDKVCVPTKQGLPGETYWAGRVETQGATGNYQYSTNLVIAGKQMTFDPYLVVKT